MPRQAIIILLAYVFGSIPLGYIFGRIKGKDIRKEGSGNIGFTNVYRVLGPRWAIFVLMFDVLKGYIFPSASFKLGLGEKVAIASSAAAICGHNWSIFLRLKGGKGVATSLGAFLSLAPIETLIALIIFLLVFFFTRIVSIGSLVASISLPILIFFITNKGLIFLFSLIAAFFIIIKHISNIRRLFKKSELKI